MFIRTVELEAQAARAAGYWSYEHWNPLAVLLEPLLLLVAVVSLIVNRWWSLLLVLLASGRVVYLLGYLFGERSTSRTMSQCSVGKQ